MDERNLTKEKRLAFLMPELSWKPGHHVVVVDQTGRKRPRLATPGKSLKPIWYRRASSFVAYAVPAGQNLRHQFSRPWQTGDQRHSLVLHYRLEFRIQDPVLLVERLASDPLKQLEDEVDALVAGRVRRLAWEVIVHEGDDLVLHLLPMGRTEARDKPSLSDSLRDFAADLGLDVMNIGVTRTLSEIEPEIKQGVEEKKRINRGLEHETELYEERLRREKVMAVENTKIAGAKAAAVRSWIGASGDQGSRAIEKLVDNINGPDDLAKAIKAVVGGARLLEGAEPIPQKQISGSAPSTLLGDSEASNEVLVSHVSPRAVKPGDSFILEVILHIHSVEPVVRDDLQVEPAVSSILLASGTELLVELTLPDGLFSIDERERVMAWRPPSTRIQFMVTAASNLAQRSYCATAIVRTISEPAIELCRFYIQIHVNCGSLEAMSGTRVKTVGRLPRSAFASYSRKDILPVMLIVAALSKYMEVFVDCLDIKEGTQWEEVLYREIVSKDTFLLFWSRHARESRWVEKEWRHALRVRGLGYISPNALEPADLCPPPSELADLQFGSRQLLIVTSALLGDGEAPNGPLNELLTRLTNEFIRLPCESAESKSLLSAALHLVAEAIRGKEAESKVLLRYGQVLDEGFRRNVDDLGEEQEKLFKRLKNVEALQRKLSL